jgi:regulator of replication initiation timing
MEKLSAQKVLSVLSAIPETLTKLASERDALRVENEKLAKQIKDYQTNERVEKIAQDVHDMGIEQGRTMEETKAVLLEKAASGELETVEQALRWSAASTPLGHVGDIPDGENSLEEYVLS